MWRVDKPPVGTGSNHCSRAAAVSIYNLGINAPRGGAKLCVRLTRQDAASPAAAAFGLNRLATGRRAAGVQLNYSPMEEKACPRVRTLLQTGSETLG